jgi:hypothetical protein
MDRSNLFFFYMFWPYTDIFMENTEQYRRLLKDAALLGCDPRCVVGTVVPNISKECRDFISPLMLYTPLHVGYVTLEYEGTMALQNVGNHSPNYTASHPQQCCHVKLTSQTKLLTFTPHHISIVS